MSLSKILLNQIISKGEISTYEVNDLADNLNYKRSNAERRLRELSDPKDDYRQADRLYNHKGVVVGYKRYSKPEQN